MAAQKTVSVLAKKFGDRLVKAHNDSKDKVPEVNAGLPEGIKNGIAQLRGCKIDEYKSGKNKGEAYFSAYGIVVDPIMHNGRKVQGLRTMAKVSLCDTGKGTAFEKSFEENYAKFLDHLKLLAGVEAIANAEALETGEEIENQLLAIMAELEESKPYFGFETWKPDPKPDNKNPDVIHKWTGAVEYTPEGVDPAMNGINETHSANGQQTAQNDATDTSESEIDIAALVELASQDEDGKSEKEVEEIISAQEKLNELAIASGKSKKEVAAAENWQAVADMIVLDSDQPAEEPEKVDTGSTGPVVGKVVKFPIRDPKKKKDVLKDCEVVTVDAKKKTVTLKNIDTDEVLKGTDKKPLQVPFDQLK